MSKNSSTKIVQAQALLHAVHSQDQSKVRQLLAGGVSADIFYNGVGAVFIAAGKGDIPMLELLVGAGTNLNLVSTGKFDPDGKAAAHLARAPGGGPVQGGKTNKRTPLNKAIAMGHTSATTWLLEHGADPRGLDARRRTSAHVLIDNAPKFASDGGNFLVKTLRSMLARGLPCDQVDEQSNTLLHAAVLAGKHALPALSLLLRHGANPCAHNASGMMPIHVAALEGRVEALQLLVAHGIGINARCATGARPVHLYQSPRMGEAIFKLHPDLEALDNDGCTALAKALQLSTPGFLDARVDALINAGASGETPDFEGLTPRARISADGLTHAAALLSARDAKNSMMDVIKARPQTEVEPVQEASDVG